MKPSVLFTLILFIGITFNVSAQTVYITNTGEKFHKSTCRYLSKSKISISLSDTKDKGYTACKVCKPSTTVTSNKSTNSEKENNVSAQSKKTKTTSKQCSAKIKAGARCKRKTTDSSGKCWQHQ